MPLLRRVSRLCRVTFPALLIAVGVSASAQINEQDRLNRCANNRARAVEIGQQLSRMWNEEQVARARNVLPKLRQSYQRFEFYKQSLADWKPTPGPPQVYNRDAVEQFKADELRNFLALASQIRIACPGQDDGCPSRVFALIEREMDNAITARPQLERQLAMFQNNLVALRCDQPNAFTAMQASGAAPSAGAPELVLTLAGATVVTDLTTKHQSPGPNDPSVVRYLPSGQTFGGSVGVRNGTLAPGETIIVMHPDTAHVLLNSPNGGSFSGVTEWKGFGAQTGLMAYVCNQQNLNQCSAQANISIQWKQ